MSNFDTPILLILFNRPNYLNRQFDVLRNLAPKQLYISIDGPRANHTKDLFLCPSIKEIVLELVNWDCQLYFNESKINLGCKNGPIAALNWFFSFVDEGIILEDDCLPNLSFFSFTSEMLKKYRHNDQIISINGCNYGYSQTQLSYVYSRFMSPWGWATWSRSVNEIRYHLYDWEHKSKYHFMKSKIGHGILDLDQKWFLFWVEIFDSLSSGKLNSAWDYYWIYHIFFHNKLVIIPTKNLVTNLGFSEYATHTTLITHPANNLLTQRLFAPYKGPKSFNNDIVYEKNYVKKICYMHNDLPFSFHLKNYFISIFPLNYLHKLITCLR